MLNEVLHLCSISLRTLRARRWESIVTITTYIGLIIIFICLSSLAEGLSGVFLKAGADDVAVVRSAGAGFGNVTLLDDSIIDEITHSDQVLTNKGFSFVFPEFQTLVKLYKDDQRIGDPVRFRGVNHNISKLRPHYQIIKGRHVVSGKHEVLVGKGLAQSHNLAIGESLHIEDKNWKIVGIFSNGGDVRESELWTDLTSLQSSYEAHSQFFLVFVKLQDPALFKDFKFYMERESTQLIEVVLEKDYFSQKAQDLTQFIDLIKMVIVPVIAICIAFCTLATAITLAEQRKWLNNLYLALGFSKNSILLAHCIESICLGLVGGLAGSVISYCLFDGYQASSFDTATTVLYQFSVSWPQVRQSTLIIIGISLIGTFYPTYQSSRQPTSSLLAGD